MVISQQIHALGHDRRGCVRERKIKFGNIAGKRLFILVKLGICGFGINELYSCGYAIIFLSHFNL
jgi:hypothetical protein